MAGGRGGQEGHLVRAGAQVHGPLAQLAPRGLPPRRPGAGPGGEGAAQAAGAPGGVRRRWSRSRTDDDGMVLVSARLAPEDAEVVLAAVEAAR